jgi:hypothetical protein
MKQKSKPFLALLFSLLFIVSCTAQQKKPDPKPTPAPDVEGPVIKVIKGEEAINEMAAANFKVGNYACEHLGYLQADMTFYNKAQLIMEWISGKKGMEYKKIVPICYGDDKKMLDEASDPNSIYVNVQKAIGLIVESAGGSVKDERLPNNGMYDSDQEIMILRQALEANGKEGTLAHELVHALQDQYYRGDFGYQSRDGYKMSAEDRWTRKALYEGEACLLKNLYLSETYPSEYKFLKPEEGRQYVLHRFSDKETIDYMGITALINRYFNYDWASYFWLDLMGGEYNVDYMKKMMDEKSYPTSTEQVIDIEKYRKKEDHKGYYKFPQDSFDKFFEDESRKLNQVDGSIWSLGQAQMGLLARLYIDSPQPLDFAKGWNGDRTLVYAAKKDGNFNWKESVFVHETSWDDEASLDEWTKNAVKILQKKYPNGFKDIGSGANYQAFEFDFGGAKKYAAIVTSGTSAVTGERLTAETAEELENFIKMAFDSMSPPVAAKDESN